MRRHDHARRLPDRAAETPTHLTRGQAAATIQARISASPALQQALASFNAAPAHAPAAARPALEEAVGAVSSGPLGANAVPASVITNGRAQPLNPIKDVAFHALDHAYSLGYVVVGICALVAAVLAVTGIGGRSDETLVAHESLAAA